MHSLGLQNISRQLEQAESVEHLESACNDFCIFSSFEYFIFGVCDAASLSSPNITTLTNYPADWLKTYFDRDMQKNDPVVRYCFESTTPIRWSDLIKMERFVSPGGEYVMLEAQKYGLADGLSIPLKAPSGEIALLSLATSRVNDTDETFNQALLVGLVFSNMLFEHYMRINFDSTVSKITLTEREKECLFWACEGKTAWEMSKIIEVSERTVTFHLTSATKKLGASNRQHAVAKAIMYGIVKPVP